MKNDTMAATPENYGLPGWQELKEYRIWDTHYHGYLTSGDPLVYNDEMLFYVKRMGIERVISVDIGGTLAKPLIPIEYDGAKRTFLEKNTGFFSGIMPIDPGFPEESCKKMDEWIKNRPCIGIKYVGGNELGITCDHPNNDIIIKKAVELNAVIYIHTWIKTGGPQNVIGGANLSGESAPWHVATLAKRFPDVQMICGHAGGDWELGARAIRAYENVYFEFSGADPQSGAVDLAVKELGADRIVWGGHGPSRSYATELAKVMDANITFAQRKKIFGENYRRLAKNIFQKKGYPFKP
jgi:predicted TIM-barrel fold metal-dependent hydrolase